jgi:hypothetical protein
VENARLKRIVTDQTLHIAAPLYAASRATVTIEDQALRAELRRISRRRARWGYRCAHQLLLDEGSTASVRSGCGARRPAGAAESGASASVSGSRPSGHSGCGADHVWAIDFQFDQTADGHNLKLLTSSMSSPGKRW